MVRLYMIEATGNGATFYTWMTADEIIKEIKTFKEIFMYKKTYKKTEIKTMRQLYNNKKMEQNIK